MSVSQVTGNMVGKRVAITRRKLDLGQVEFAAILCVDYKLKLERVQISQIERGIRSVKDKELDILAKALKTTPNYLMGWN